MVELTQIGLGMALGVHVMLSAYPKTLLGKLTMIFALSYVVDIVFQLTLAVCLRSS